MKRFSMFALVLCLTACSSSIFKPKETKKPGQEKPLDVAAAATDTATKTADEAAANAVRKDAERDAKVLANVNHARERNQDNPDGTPKTVVDGDLQVAQGLLSDVQPDPAEVAARERDAKLVEAGKAAEARANYANAAQDARKLTEELAAARIEAQNALAERDAARQREATARANFIAQLEQNKRDNQAAIDKLNAEHQKQLDAERRWFLRMVSYALVGCAVVSILIGAFLTYSKVQTGDIFKAGITAAVFGGGAAFALTCAWTINQPWFKWVVIGGGSLGLVGGIIFAWTEVQDAKRNKQRHIEADEAEETLVELQNVLDKELPKDAPLFQKLSSKLDRKHKALLNELKAEAQRRAPA